MSRARLARRIAGSIAGAIVAVAFMLPLLWVVTSSLRTNQQIFTYISNLSWRMLIPVHPVLVNYLHLGEGDFGRAVINSLVVSGVTVVLGLAICASAAFGLSAIKFRGQNVVFAVIVVSFLVPFDAIAIPLASLFRDWGLQNTYPGLILPGLIQGLAIFVLRQFFLQIPGELVDAGRIDGLGWLGIFFKIYLPLSRPALVGAALMLFLSQWQSYLWPLLIGTDNAHTLAPIALGELWGRYSVDYGQLFAGCVVLTIIPLLFILRFQRYFVRSMTTAGLK